MQKYANLSDEDKKILEEHHRKSKNPENPEHPRYDMKHHEFLKGLVSRFGNAAVFGAGATAGSDMINGLFK
ncbi:hypothetical protein LTS15_010638 [Exophiala xenobiotica]|nr:hypothetical protein LTS15_010638 [Exophiala xenobiotica]